MQATDIHTHARRLLETMGSRALAEAARQIKQHERSGALDEAADWRRIEAAMVQMRGPRAK